MPNHAYSPLPALGEDRQVVPGTGLRKFVDPLPGLGPLGRTPHGAHLPVAVPDTITYPGCDYYEIGLQEYTQRLHRDLPATRLRGYRQLNLGTNPDGHNTVAPPRRPWHLGPVVLARRGRPVRVKFINQLPTGDLFLPVDPTVPGAGPGPLDGPAPYPQNRAVPHLCGALTGWISAGGPWQWITPAGEITPYPTGAGLAHVPDMPHPGQGATTRYYPNDQSGRLLWFHDNTIGLARLTSYSGQLALYLLTDDAQERLIADGTLPSEQLPLVFEDKTFVPDDAQLAAQDPTWDRDRWGSRGSLWHPHVYQVRQNPYRRDGINPTGRWDYGPWSRTAPAGADASAATVPNPHHDPVTDPDEPPETPGVPQPSAVPAAYGDTVLVNGAAYPYLEVQPKVHRWRILNACTDRWLNLQLYRAASDTPMWTPDGTLVDAAAGEVPMVDAVRAPDRPTDGRPGGVPDPTAAGPEMIRIGNEGGLLPAPVVVPNRPIGFRHDRRDPTVLNVDGHALLLAPGERADVLVDFAAVDPGTTLILYNDCPVPLPCFDPRYDHHTGDPDRTAEGGAPPTVPGYGPNTRTLLQLRVTGTPAPPYDLDRLWDRLPAAYAASQRPPVVPQPAYDPCFGTTSTATRIPVHASTVEFTPPGGAPVRLPLTVRSVCQVFEPEYGRLVGRLGVAHPHGGPRGAATLPLGSTDPATEVVYASDPALAVGTPGDGSQLWRVRGCGRQSHPVRFDGLDVQVIGRVGRDGRIRPPHPGELGWKQVVRVDPGEDVLLALRPEAPPLPFKIGDSVRLLDPTRPADTRLDSTPVSPVDGRPASVVNQLVNLGWEYRWGSAAAGHRDLGMSRPLVVRVSPRAPAGDHPRLDRQRQPPAGHQPPAAPGHRRDLHQRADHHHRRGHRDPVHRRHRHPGRHLPLPHPRRDRGQLLHLVEQRSRVGTAHRAGQADRDRATGRTAAGGTALGQQFLRHRHRRATRHQPDLHQWARHHRDKRRRQSPGPGGRARHHLLLPGTHHLPGRRLTLVHPGGGDHPTRARHADLGQRGRHRSRPGHRDRGARLVGQHARRTGCRLHRGAGPGPGVHPGTGHLHRDRSGLHQHRPVPGRDLPLPGALVQRGRRLPVHRPHPGHHPRVRRWRSARRGGAAHGA